MEFSKTTDREFSSPKIHEPRVIVTTDPPLAVVSCPRSPP
jgi:hypothetical protein